MASLNPAARSSVAAAPSDDAVEKLCGAFLNRLQTERLQFATLSAALAKSEDNPMSIFQDLQFRAHRLKGAAAIFEFRDLTASAHALETAAAEAARANADNCNAAVWSALVALVSLLGTIRNEAAPVFSAGASQERGRPAQ